MSPAGWLQVTWSKRICPKQAFQTLHTQLRVLQAGSRALELNKSQPMVLDGHFHEDFTPSCRPGVKAR